LLIKASLASISVLLVFALAMVPPHFILQPSQFSTADTKSDGRQVTMTGTLRFAFETPACFPRCKTPSVGFPYIVVNGQNYLLLGAIVLSHCPNEEVTVTGWLKVPSEWASKMYTPSLIFTGDLTVVSLYAANINSSEAC